ncbi:cell wall-binding repeat-containing protein [Streptomyces barringtoniae]|uniref:cell wall-binding repeat-containing protein n=1 Tax=Streptomyces barringtoniae TaxID=2892029 RepID=UPI001E2A2554|nr:cell wall-binding repeat-containing protein [Streptomyces barringtoniae]MCC5477058.1 cell wall-binding repeat-containing protein [Streptomyces barringtoniae]
MRSRTRRRLAALTSAASLAAAGLLGAAAPGAQAATATDGVTAGQIGLYGGSTGVETVNADGTGLRSVPNIPNYGYTPNWAPDGSRVVAGWSQLSTGRVTGSTSLLTLPWATKVRSSASYEDPAFWLDGRYVVFSTGGQLAYGPSDGSWAPEPLLTATQEPSTVCDVHPTASPAGTLAFERRHNYGCYDSQGIWTYNPSTKALKNIIASGSSPVFSADGGKLVFTREVDGWTQLFTANADGSDVKQVTTDPSDHLSPTWDPAGGRIAYEAHSSHAGWSDDVQTVRVLDLAAGTSAQVTGAGKGAKPAWQPLRKNTLVRVYGTGSVGIDGAASRWTFDTVGGTHVPGLITARSAVLVNKGNGTYSAPAIALAAEKQGPVLMTSGSGLDSAAATELKRSLPKGSTVYLDGSTRILASKVAGQVQALGYKPLRLDAPDLSSLSARVARQISATPSWIFVADGNDYHDPIAASTAAGALGYHGTGVVLLTNGKTVLTSVKNYLNALNPKTTNMVTVGYNATQAMEHTPLNKVWSFWTIGGKAHEDVAANLARFWWSAPTQAVVEDTWTWQNAVAGGAATATYGPMLWSAESSLSAPASNYLNQEAASVWVVQTFGGNASYPAANRTAIASAIAASSAWTTTHWVANGELPATAAARSTFASAGSAADSARPAPDPTVVPGRHLPAPDAHGTR